MRKLGPTAIHKMPKARQPPRGGARIQTQVCLTSQPTELFIGKGLSENKQEIARAEIQINCPKRTCELNLGIYKLNPFVQLSQCPVPVITSDFVQLVH